MTDLCKTAERLASFNTTVLITGASGTGKELFARAIHNHSPRSERTFVAINCGAIPENLIESELFGHSKGAFTGAAQEKRGLFEEASGGTLFLDEVGELPLNTQTKILRVLQEQEILRIGDTKPTPIDVRIIAATHKDLDRAVYERTFRSDLFYRLNVAALHLPTLAERSEDLPRLIDHFLALQSKKHRLGEIHFDQRAFQCLLNYSWPGNIRELENCIERAAVFGSSTILGPETLPKRVANAGEHLLPARLAIDSSDLSIKKRSINLEIELIGKALRRTKGNHTHAAKILEISHRALLYKLKEYGFSSKRG